MNAAPKQTVQATVQTSIAAVLASLMSLGFIHIKGPDTLIRSADPKLLQQIARPNAFTSDDFDKKSTLLERRIEERIEKEVEPLRVEVTVIKDMFREFMLEGPKAVRRDLATAIAQIKELKQEGRAQHKEAQKIQAEHYAVTKQMQQQQQQTPWRR